MIYLYLTHLFNFIVCAILIEKYLHIYQLKDYKNSRFLRFFKKKLYIFVIFLAFFVIFLINYLFFNNNLIFNISLNLSLIFINAIFSTYLISSNKTPIKYTPRVKRLYIIGITILFVIDLIPYGVLINCFAMIFLPIMANALNFIDRYKNKRFIKSARQKLRLNNTRIIAITGSNGKTSVKNILCNILSKKYLTQMTPKSFNTELGISKFINENLIEGTDYLILEYGARQVGDIKRLCHIFGADLGIVVSIAPQHLETFHSIENVYKTKKELPDYLGANLCVYNLDNPYTKRMYDEKIGKKIGVSLSSANIHAENIKIIDGRTNFDLVINDKRNPVSTALLGRHNVTNILLAVALAYELKVSITDILDAIANLEPVPHRLELIKTHINILDDSYNCSIESAKEALWVLQNMPNAHAVATPGIIEGGREQYNINFQLGTMLSNCDIVIIIGETNKTAILDGLKSAGYNKTLFTTKNLDEAKTHFAKLKKGDTLLLLNDLPDDFK